MTIQKPERLYRVLSREFDKNDLADISYELDVDVEDLSDRKSARARELVQYASRRRKTDVLIDWVWGLIPDIDFHPYLYTLVAENFHAAADIQRISDALGIDYQQQLVEGLGYFSAGEGRDVIQAQSWEIYRLLHEQERLGELVRYLQENVRPPLKLDRFAAVTPPAPPQKRPSDGPAGKADAATPAPNQPAIETMEYEDFDLRINDGQDGFYDVEVLYSPQGQVRKVRQEFPLKDPEFQDLLTYLKDLWAEEGDALKLGRKMRSLLFPPDVWAKFRESRAAMAGENKGLRVRLRIDPPELSNLPWEYVYDETFSYLAHDKMTPIVRYPAESLPQSDLSADFPIRILLVTANPTDLKQLKVEREEQLVHEALAPLIATELAQVDVITKAQIRDVRKALSDGQYHVFHFIGHGKYENGKGAIVLENEDGSHRKIFANQLQAMLRGTGVRFIFLNACETAAYAGDDPISSVSRALLRAGIPAIMAMQFEVPDQTSLLLSRTLYESLVLGRPLDEAVTEMRRATYIETEDMVFWGIPVLYMRAPDGIIWQADEEAAAKLAAYQPEPPLTGALKKAENYFGSIENELDADAQEFRDDLREAQELAAGELGDIQKKKLLRKIDGLIELLEIYGIDINDKTMVALSQAKGLV